MPKNFDKKLKEMLEECGLPYTIEYGKKHIHVRVSNRLVLVTPRGARGGRGEWGFGKLAARKSLERAIKNLGGAVPNP